MTTIIVIDMPARPSKLAATAPTGPNPTTERRTCQTLLKFRKYEYNRKLKTATRRGGNRCQRNIITKAFGLTSPQLAACLPPREAHLEKIVIRIAADQARRLPPADRPELKVLFTVADALLHNLGRKRPLVSSLS